MATGDALAKKKQWGKATQEFEAALALRPSDFEALAEVGWCAVNDGKIERAREASALAVEAAPNKAKKGMALFNLGLAFDAEDPRSAFALYVESRKQRPNKTVADYEAKASSRMSSAVQSLKGAAMLTRLHVPMKPVEDAIIIEALSKAGSHFEWGAGNGGSITRLVCKTAGGDTTCSGKDEIAGTNLQVTGEAAALIVKSAPAATSAVEVKCYGSSGGYEPGAVPPEWCEVTAPTRSR